MIPALAVIRLATKGEKVVLVLFNQSESQMNASKKYAYFFSGDAPSVGDIVQAPVHEYGQILEAEVVQITGAKRWTSQATKELA